MKNSVYYSIDELLNNQIMGFISMTYNSMIASAIALASVMLTSTVPIVFGQMNNETGSSAMKMLQNNGNMTSYGNATMTAGAQSNNSKSSDVLSLAHKPFLQQHIPTTNDTDTENGVLLNFSGNGTLMLANSNAPIKYTFTGNATVDFSTMFLTGTEYITTEEGQENATIFIQELSRFDPQTMTGKGIHIVTFQTNSTGQIKSLDGMIGVGTDKINADGSSDQTVWEWQSGIPYIKELASGP